MATVGERVGVATKSEALEPAWTVGKERGRGRPGMEVPRIFSMEGLCPFDQVDWELRTAEIKEERGRVIFQQKDCEVPRTWSQLATNVVSSKYFYGDVASGNGSPSQGKREYSVRQLIHRVTRTIADWGKADGYFATSDDAERFYDELTALCLNQYGSFNSPVWFNVGLFHQYGVSGPANNWRWEDETRGVLKATSAYQYPQSSACFIQSVSDDMEGIMKLATSEAMLFKFGSGTGTDLSTLRSSREKLSGGGRPSGPVSFMRVYDAIASVVKSGGKTRRAAKMQTLKCWHPDILEFIECKTKEEKKAQALIRSGYEANFNGEAYSSVMFQNANLSVRCTDAFLHAVESDEDWTTRSVTTGQPMETYQARMLMDKIAEGTWLCGDPGVQYEDTIQRWHTCPNTAPINSSNPCSEYMFIDDSACNLSSINLMKFRRDDGGFRCRAVPGGRAHLHHGARDPGGPRELPDRADRGQQPQVPAAGAGVCEPGKLADVLGPAVRLPGRACAGGRHHVDHARAGLPDQCRARGPSRSIRGVCRQPRADAQGHGDAPRRRRGDRSVGAGRSAGGVALGLGRLPRAGPQPRLSQQPGDGPGADRHDRVHDGLRHNRHRARHRAGEVQAVGWRRYAQDRQPHRADGTAQAGVR